MKSGEDLMVVTRERLCTTPSFTHPGFTCEVTPDGKVIMSPTFNYHGWFQARLSILLAQHAPLGQPFVELAVLTEFGLFEVGVAWDCDYKRIRQQKVCSPAPEVCIEVESASSTEVEFGRKRSALFAAGCGEFWIARSDGAVEFYAPSGRMQQSRLVLGFPNHIDD